MPRIGLISDTHGLLRPQALAYLESCDHIVHAGDICDPRILEALARIAPVTAVRGNNDVGPWALALPEVAQVRIDAITILVVHDLGTLDDRATTAGAHVVVSGHSHRPRIQQRGEVLYVNPGSAGPRRFSLPISIGELTITGGSVAARTTELRDTAGFRP